MALFCFDLIRLIKGQGYRVSLAIPWIYLLVIFLYYLLKVDQSSMDQRSFYLDDGTDSDPFYNWLSQILMGLFLVVIPLQTTLMCSLGNKYDRQSHGWRIIARCQPLALKSHLSLFSAHLVLFILVYALFSVVLATSIWTLPVLFKHLEFSENSPTVSSILRLTLLPCLVCIPQLILHYWLTYTTHNITLSLLLVFLMILITYTLWDFTVYYVPVKFVADGLLVLEDQLGLRSSSGADFTIRFRHLILCILTVVAGGVLAGIFKRR